jgi:hypothetical protein
VDNVCAWPNLTLMPDGAIVATVFSQPCHGQWEGDVECWASEDGGRLWRLRGIPAPHEAGTNRMNVSAGLAKNGDLVVLASGWDRRPPKGQPPASHVGAQVLPAWVCRSRDGGRAWEIAGSGMPPPPKADMCHLIPFGDVLVGGDGALYASAYAGCLKPEGGFDGRDSSFFLRSADDGRTWSVRSMIAADDYNETAILHLGERHWLAAARTARRQHLELLRSDDEGATWRRDQSLSLPRQIPAHLLRLQDKRLLLVYGMRCPQHSGVAARLSEDEGATWSVPALIVQFTDGDGGYPASVQSADGKIVTAYYCKAQPDHQRYHMGVAICDPDEFKARW